MEILEANGVPSVATKSDCISSHCPLQKPHKTAFVYHQAIISLVHIYALCMPTYTYLPIVTNIVTFYSRLESKRT